MPNDPTVTVVSSASAFRSLRGEWDGLLDAAASPSIFLGWDWLYSWWEVYAGPADRLHIVLVRDGGRLVGLAPLYVTPVHCLAGLRARRLQFIGMGEPEWEEVASERMDVIARRGCEAQVVSALWRSLSADHGWDEALLDNMPEDGVLLCRLSGLLAAAGWFHRLADEGIDYHIDFSGDWETYLASLSRNRRKQIRSNLRRFAREGQLVHRRIRSRDELEAAFEELVRLHTLRWRRRGESGVFGAPRFHAFQQRVMPRLLESGCLDLHLVALDGETIAALYNMRLGDTVYSYQSGFSYPRHSPGLLSDTLAMEQAIEEGCRRYDFLKGGEDSFKAGFGCNTTRICSLSVCNRTPAGRLLATARRLQRLAGRLSRLAGRDAGRRCRRHCR